MQTARHLEPCKSEPSGKAGEELRVLKIQRTCVHDGPGIRTVIFFPGCHLRCLWCQNPEAIHARPEGAQGARSAVSDILQLVLRDKAYYESTGGGVTLSGGDPLLQDPDRLLPLLQRLREENVHVAAETSLHVPWKNVERLAPHIDLFLVDLKIVGDDVQHRRCTGKDARLIRANIQKLLGLNALVKFRMVMVPGHNDTEENLRAAAAFLRSHGHHRVELLKYHSMYEDKAARLGIALKPLRIGNEQAVASVRSAVDAFGRFGIRAECLALEAPRHQAEFPDRVHRVQKAIRESPHSLCFEVSKLKTAYYRKNGFRKPNPVHRAERLAYVLRNKQVILYPDELLVGNFTSKRRGGQIWEEHYGALFVLTLHQIHRQKPVSFQCSWQDRLQFYTRIAPLWARHALMSKVYKSPRDLLLGVARLSEMNVGFNNNLAAIAHFIVNYERLLQLGTTGIIREIETAKRENPGHNQAFYEGAVIALRGLEAFAERYARRLAEAVRQEADPVRRRELEAMAAVCRHVPRHPARTYHEALQSMLFLHIAICIESFENAISPGRLDQILHPYYLRDKEAGIIDYARARELLALFILKMDEALLINDGDTYMRLGRLFETMSTDQTVTAGGLGRDGRDATNELTYALLDICELQPYAVNMTARIHPGSPAEYLDRLAEVYINGAPMPALYNDEIYVDTLQRHYDTTAEDARNYAIVGCVEPNASDDHFGNTDCANMNVALPFLQALKGEEDDLWNFGVPDQIEKLLTKFVEYHFQGDGRLSRAVASGYASARQRYKKGRASRPNPPADMPELLARFQERLNRLATSILTDHQRIEAAIRRDFATPLASALSRNCVATGKDVNEGGARFNSSGIQAVGITDVADSLHALDEVVFRKRLYTLHDVIDAMDHDFRGGPRHQEIRETLLAVPKFGEDGSPAAAAWVNRTLQVYVDALKQVPGCPRDGIYTAGYYALNVNDVYGKKTPSLPSGRLRGVPLANSVAPHYGMQATDLLSALNSVAGVDFARYAPNGTTVTFTIDAALFQGTDGVRNLSSIFSTFFRNGGMQFQPNVISRDMLLDAYRHPEKYPYLLVRVAGYCAYFNDLSDDLKKIIIHRTCYG